MVGKKMVLMRKQLLVALFSLFLLMSGLSVFAADYDVCRSDCETAESDCKQRINSPNDLDMQDALKACDDGMTACYDRCEKEKAIREQQEKELQEKNNEKSPFVSPQDL